MKAPITFGSLCWGLLACRNTHRYATEEDFVVVDADGKEVDPMKSAEEAAGAAVKEGSPNEDPATQDEDM